MDENIREENRRRNAILILVGIVVALVAGLVVLYRLDKRVQRLCLRLEHKLKPRKSAPFRVDFEEDD